MNEDETRAYYDIPANAEYMCDVLMRAHPDWTVWRDAGFWYAQRTTWAANRRLLSENAGLLNQSMFITEAFEAVP
jgi:hypothetical protein